MLYDSRTTGKHKGCASKSRQICCLLLSLGVFMRKQGASMWYHMEAGSVMLSPASVLTPKHHESPVFVVVFIPPGHGSKPKLGKTASSASAVCGRDNRNRMSVLARKVSRDVTTVLRCNIPVVTCCLVYVSRHWNCSYRYCLVLRAVCLSRYCYFLSLAVKCLHDSISLCPM